MKITIIAGARPNFMKIAPIWRAIDVAKDKGEDFEARLVFTGKQEDPSLEPSIFTDLGMPQPDVCLGVDSNDYFQRMAGILVAFARELEEHPAQLVMVVDDLTPTMACSIVAHKKGIKVAHLVAGIRNFDLSTPKELNRLISDGLSDILFTASPSANRNLTHTGVEQTKIYLVGNILMDTLRQNYHRFTQPAELKEWKLEDKQYILLTLNRRKLLDDKAVLRQLINTLLENTDLPILAPVHDYVKESLTELNICNDRLKLLSPQSYLNFGYLESHAHAIVTDSGNVAEEATFLGLPCITLNKYAEHQETVTLGTNCLVGQDAETLKEALQTLKNGKWKEGHLPERWDGRTAERIVQILSEINL